MKNLETNNQMSLEEFNSSNFFRNRTKGITSLLLTKRVRLNIHRNFGRTLTTKSL